MQYQKYYSELAIPKLLISKVALDSVQAGVAFSYLPLLKSPEQSLVEISLLL